jgi:CheY-like chemotaxis protein
VPKLLFIDDEPYNLELAIEILGEAIDNCTIAVTETAQDSIQWLSEHQADLVIMDIFLPLGNNIQDTLGPRAKEYQDNLRHLGGIAILDFLEKQSNPPKVLTHTACTDFALLEILGDIVHDRIPKPASVEVLLEVIQRELSTTMSTQD